MKTIKIACTLSSLKLNEAGIETLRSSCLTWGAANHTLVPMKNLLSCPTWNEADRLESAAMKKIGKAIKKYGANALIDLEN